MASGWRQKQKTALKERLYQVALQLFRSCGYEATTVLKITEAAGVGKGTFHNYFPGKEHVLADWYRTVTLDALEDLRDMVWALAHLTFENEGQSVALIPARYPATEEESDSMLKLSRKTEWQEPYQGLYTGLGQKMFATNLQEYPLLSTRQIDFNVSSDSEAD